MIIIILLFYDSTIILLSMLTVAEKAKQTEKVICCHSKCSAAIKQFSKWVFNPAEIKLLVSLND